MCAKANSPSFFAEPTEFAPFTGVSRETPKKSETSLPGSSGTPRESGGSLEKVSRVWKSLEKVWVCLNLCHFALLKRGCANSVVGLELADMCLFVWLLAHGMEASGLQSRFSQIFGKQWFWKAMVEATAISGLWVPRCDKGHSHALLEFFGLVPCPI